MKVKVNVKHVPLNQVEYFLNGALSEALADLDAAHREIERLIQENKELRLAEARILSDKKKAEADLSALKKQMHDQEEKACDEYTKVFEELVSLRSKFSDTCADRDNLEAAYKQVQASMGQIIRNFEETRKELEGAEKVIESLETQLTRAELCNTALENRLEEVTAELLKHEMGHYKRECEEWKQTADELADQLKDAHDRIAEQQRTIADCSDTIVTLKTTAELRPQFSNLWQLLKETGMIVDTEGGVHNHE